MKLFNLKIHLHNNNYSACEASLENGLSYNFEVKDSPIYHIIRSKIQKKQNNLNGAKDTLSIAMNLPGVKRPGNFNFISHCMNTQLLKFLTFPLFVESLIQ